MSGYASPTSTGSAGAQVLCNKIAQILKKHDGGKMAIKDVLTELHQEVGDKAPSEMNPQELAGKVNRLLLFLQNFQGVFRVHHDALADEFFVTHVEMSPR